VISSSSSSSEMPVENSSDDDDSSGPYEISRIGRRRRASPPGPIVNVNVNALLETTIASAPWGTTTGRTATTATDAITTANAAREQLQQQQQQQPTSPAGVEQRFAQYMTLAGTSASVANLSATSVRSMMEESKMPGSSRSERECSVAPESHNHDHHRDHRVIATTPSTTQRSYSSPSLSTQPDLHLHSHSPTLWLEQTARILGQGEQELEHDDDYHSHLLEQHRGLPMAMLHSAILDHDERLNREVEELFGSFLEGDDVHSL